jgi:2-polyprenyl-3-methyl-5-hydroxy-6-metoxy-1,4-benzoquinol methylase
MQVKDHFLSQEVFELQATQMPGVLRTYPTPPDLGKYYESENYISHFQNKNSLKERIYRQVQKLNLGMKKQLLLKHASPQAKILDYGCGAGEFLNYIKTDFEVLGFEPSAKARAFAAEKIGAGKLIQNLDEIKDESLDFITLWHVLEHIAEPEMILKQLKQKLKANGQLILALPNHQSYDAQYYKNFWAAYDVPRHLYHYSPQGIAQLLASVGLKFEKKQGMWFDAFYIGIMSSKYKKTPLFWLFGGLLGAISNFKAVFSGDFSSMIYTVKK